MTTVGEILRTERLEKKLSLADVEKATHIRVKFLDALERGRYDLLPSATFSRGFVKNYAGLLGLNTDDVLAFYRRETSREKLSLSSREVPRIRKFILTPRMLALGGTFTLVFLFFVYLLFQYLSYSGRPFLEVSRPADYEVVRIDQIIVQGKTAVSASLDLNGKSISVDQEGNFSVEIPLSPGLNILTITAQNKFKKQNQAVRHVRLETP